MAWLAFLARKPERHAALFLRKWLREAIRAEEVQAKLTFRPGATLTLWSFFATKHQQLEQSASLGCVPAGEFAYDFLTKQRMMALLYQQICIPLTCTLDAAGQASASEFRGLSAALVSAPTAAVRHASLLQYGRAAAATAQGASAAVHWETMQREERQLALAASEGVHQLYVPQAASRWSNSPALCASGPEHTCCISAFATAQCMGLHMFKPTT